MGRLGRLGRPGRGRWRGAITVDLDPSRHTLRIPRGALTVAVCRLGFMRSSFAFTHYIRRSGHDLTLEPHFFRKGGVWEPGRGPARFRPRPLPVPYGGSSWKPMDLSPALSSRRGRRGSSAVAKQIPPTGGERARREGQRESATAGSGGAATRRAASFRCSCSLHQPLISTSLKILPSTRRRSPLRLGFSTSRRQRIASSL